MFNYHKIKELVEQKVSIKEEFYSKIGMTRIGFTNMMKNQSLKVETLEKIANYFNLPVAWFFDEADAISEASLVDKSAIIVKGAEMEVDFRKKYYDLLEDYKILSDEIRRAAKPAPRSSKTAADNIHKP